MIGFGNPLLAGSDAKDRRAWERQKCPSAQEQAAHIEGKLAAYSESRQTESTTRPSLSDRIASIFEN